MEEGKDYELREPKAKSLKDKGSAIGICLSLTEEAIIDYVKEFKDNGFSDITEIQIVIGEKNKNFTFKEFNELIFGKE